jgi:hypothetical protein
MELSPCFVYQPGIHFTLPPELRYAPQTICEFAVMDNAGIIHPHPSIFKETVQPEDAEFFIFPFDIGIYSDKRLLQVYNSIIPHLPFYAGKERRHIVCDNGDNQKCLEYPLCLFKISLPLRFADRVVATWYNRPEHVLDDIPDFNWNNIKYDVSFVGNMSNEVRKMACLSVQRQKDLRSKIDFDDRFQSDTHSGVRRFVIENRSPEYIDKRQLIYRKSIKNSLAVLCPPGVGPQSIRMYETMYLARIPVLFDVGCVYPFQDSIDYDNITFSIKKDEILQTDSLIARYIKSSNADELHERCLYACKIWNQYFSDEQRLKLLLQSALRKWPASSS